ncbi:MAG: hypothetical protein MR504_03700 [Methanobrevibacter woesei]|uniref:tetratricopeptide repeat protein n=1 Tax=Methanobrevibacter woesei TaxID=190976 RepID=UPI0023F32345|nr:hypothetical protein [Methanobrevibacter woesei]MCI7291290.1 hypothetical protein [Methanobrevibacter woesei]
MSKLIEKARELEHEGDLEVSRTYYEMALSDKSCPFDIRSDMGRVLNKLRNFDEALMSFDMVLSMDENHVNSLFGKGIACLGLNRWDDALDLFLKGCEIDIFNANFYFYSSIILQSKNDNKAEEYYSKFIELDNEEFKEIRSNYNFGLIFLNSESKLKNGKKINLFEFNRILKSFNLSDEEIICYLKTLPYDMLILKINELNDLKHVEDEKQIIRNQFLEMGLDDSDIDDLFSIETVDYLKQDIISRTNNNPFPDKEEFINIPLYIDEDIFEFNYGNYIFKELKIKESFTKSICNKLRRIKNRNKPVEKTFKQLYRFFKKAIAENDFQDAKIYSTLIDESKISNVSFKVNFIYLRGLVLAYLNLDLDKVLEEFNQLEIEHPEIANDKNYIFNKRNIIDNLEKNN